MNRWLLMTALLVCASCSPPATPVAKVDRAELISARVAMVEKAKGLGFDSERLKCPARTVSDNTAEVMLLMWVNERQDLVDSAQLRTVSDDMMSAFEKCGADMGAVINEMKTSDDALMKGLSVAILQAGRGLK